MPTDKFQSAMADYVPVNERIGAFYEKHPEGSLQSELVELNPDRVVMRAYAYRTPDDARPGIGYSSLEIPGRTPYTRGSEIENCETSAWGRAIAALGFEVKRGIASAEEVANKSGPEPAKAAGPEERLMGKAARVGVVKKGTAVGYKLEGRKDSQGRHSIGFRLETKDGAIPQVLATEDFGEAVWLALAEQPERLLKKTVGVKGFLYAIIEQGRQTYYRLVLSSIDVHGADGFKIPADVASPDGTLPAPAVPSSAPQDDVDDVDDVDDAAGEPRTAFDAGVDLEEPPDDVELPFEAPSEELGLVP